MSQNIRELGDDSRIYQMARVTLDRMSRDLTSLQRSKDAFVLQSEDGSIGKRSFEAITFWSAAHLVFDEGEVCLLYTSPSPRDRTRSRMPSSA